MQGAFAARARAAPPRLMALLALMAVMAVMAVPWVGAASMPPAPAPVADSPYHLPGHVVPTRYHVHVAPRMPHGIDRFYFDGSVDIAAYVISATNSITMHAAANVQVIEESVEVTRGNREKLTRVRVFTEPTYEFLIIQLEETLNVRDAVNIRLKYSATYPDRMEGFYKSTYNHIDEQGKEIERMLFATHFAPTFTRRAFPAFDEPRYRATFKLSVDIPPGFSALSNTPAEERTVRNVNGRLTDTVLFLETPKMPAYLLAFLLYEEFTYSQTPTINSSVAVTAWAPKSEIDAGQATFSQSETPKFLSLMESYTDIPFARENLQKIDEIAIPDFPTSAMENWGLIAFREGVMLLDAEQSSAYDRQTASEFIALEIANQWFGNLVTPELWDYAWLSKGLSRYFQYWMLGQLNPDWRMDERLLVDIQQSIFEVDMLSSGRTLTTPVSEPQQIVEHFGAITYDKGCSMVRMIKNIIGEDNLQEALRSYLQDNQLGSATPAALFAALDAHAPAGAVPEDMALSDVLRHWTEEVPGLPVLNVDAWNANTIYISQKRFVISDDDIHQEYYIQYQIHQQSGTSTPKRWSGPKKANGDYVDIASTEQWVLINSTGYFRVNYWTQNWERLGAALRADARVVAPLERAQLIDDAFNLARINHLHYVTALDFVRYLANETDYVPWVAAFRGLDYLRNMLADSERFSEFSAFELELLQGVYARLGFQAEGDHLQRLLRAQVLDHACAAGHSECLEAADERLRLFLQHGHPVEPDLQRVVYCYGIKFGGKSVWEKMAGLYQTSDNPRERALIIESLGCVNDQNILEKFLKLSLQPEFVRPQDAASVFIAVYSNPKGVAVAFDFLRLNYYQIKNAYGSIGDLKNIFRGISTRLNKSYQLVEINLLMADKPELGDSSTVAFHTVWRNVEWMNRRREEALNAMKPVTLF